MTALKCKAVIFFLILLPTGASKEMKLWWGKWNYSPVKKGSTDFLMESRSGFLRFFHIIKLNTSSQKWYLRMKMQVS